MSRSHTARVTPAHATLEGLHEHLRSVRARRADAWPDARPDGHLRAQRRRQDHVRQHHPRQRVLYVSIDDENLRPVSKLKHYRVVKIRDWKHIWTVYDWLRNQKAVTTVVWDTWSRVQDLAVGQVCNYHPSDPALLSKYVDNIPKNPHDWRGWGQVGALCSEWQRNFNVLPVNILYLMQEQDRQSETEFGTVTRT